MSSPDLAAESAPPARDRALAAITNESLLWAAITAFALLTRALHLDEWPLTNAEALNALGALGLSQNTAATVLNPLYVWLTAATFSIFGAGEASARLWPAIAGTALCLMPVVLRLHGTVEAGAARAPRLSPPRALILGGLLALSPTLIFVSRQANGAMLAWGLALFAWATWQRGAPRVSIVLVGLLLACGADAVTPLLVCALSLILGAIRVKASRQTGGNRVIGVGMQDSQWRDIRPIDALIAIGAFVLASTGMLTHIAGLSEALNGLLQWNRAAAANPLTLNRVAAGIAIYEPLIWVFGLIAAAVWLYQRWAARGAGQDIPAPPLSSAQFWLLAGGLASMLFAPSRAADEAVPLVVGGALLASAVIAPVLVGLARDGRPGRDGVVASICLVMMFVGNLGLLNYASQGQTLWVTTSLLSIAMVGLATVACGMFFGSAAALRGLCVALLIFLTIGTLATLVHLTQIRYANPGEPYAADAVPQSMKTAVQEINTASMRTRSDKNALRLQVSDTAPAALRWALREQNNATYVPKPEFADGLLFPAGVEPAGIGAYVGNDFDIGRTGALESARCIQNGNQLDCTPLAKWLAFRDLPSGSGQKWVLWLRQGLSGGNGGAAR